MLDDACKWKALAQLLTARRHLVGAAGMRFKQDAKNFRWRQMANEREKRARLEPLYPIARPLLLPRLAILASAICTITRAWANFYTVYDLRRPKTEQTHLYLLCYASAQRVLATHRQSLSTPLSYHMKQIEDESKARTNTQFVAEQARMRASRKHRGRRALAVALCR